MMNDEKLMLAEYSQLKQFLGQKGLQPTDLPSMISQNDQMKSYLKEKGMEPMKPAST